MIDIETAERIKTLLSDIQDAVYNESAIPEPVRDDLINLISDRGFGLVDELQAANP
jgi:hypothetical protein